MQEIREGKDEGTAWPENIDEKQPADSGCFYVLEGLFIKQGLFSSISYLVGSGAK